MTRADVLRHMRTAGYHGDRARWTRLFIESRISFQAADGMFREGERAKKAGVTCTCRECTDKTGGKP